MNYLKLVFGKTDSKEFWFGRLIANSKMVLFRRWLSDFAPISFCFPGMPQRFKASMCLP